MKVGDYVRTKKNKIYKIIDKKFDETILVVLYQTDISGYLMEMDIKKSSPNIIDLIEVGDYVNGFKVEEVLSNSVGYRGVDDYIYDCGEIKSIVTKEQFEEMEYKIND